MAARADSSHLALLFLDVDGLKEINDQLGHATGDELLRETADRIRMRLRRSDLAARLGGDEFLVIVPDLDPASSREQASEIARELTAAIRAPLHISERDLTITASTGASIYPTDGQDYRSLLHRADQRMYAAKRSRRGQSAHVHQI